ncbi:stage II sporulation protein D [Aneurinibacillus soli]|uniref:Amidase enhancer n=1 Tax=Aneurinibacillus soli TaxID=1500254 RepID=A0A0U5B8G4_9BACL|nr:stage II sporulation protein D [Aneurinibacillus soli]PYE61559.1 stage II sporulation protein D [Aneurinibacillus soli]BAU26487.1 Amidase enhancer precursor [Aneurinibacillus soli]
MKNILYFVVAVIGVLLAVPSILVLIHTEPEAVSEKPASMQKASTAAISPTGKQEKPITFPIKVLRVETGKVESIPLEQYVAGVVAGEMPAEFEVEALKAQALAARTYITLRIAKKDFSDVPKQGHVTDTIKHQVYLDDKQRRARWGSTYDWKNERIVRAVQETAGQILTYENQPINATFFSTSNGYTENAEDYWGSKIPYLRSVKVPWDTASPRYETTVTIPIEQVEKRLKTKLAIPTGGGPSSWQKVLSRTVGQRVKEIKIGDKTYTGRSVRELLDLNSSHFTLSIEKKNVVVHTLGYGHGVGMSQWGANGMAKEGKKAEEIVAYFYKGVQIQNAEKWLK